MRIETVDTMFTLGARLGRERGFSGSVHTSAIVATTEFAPLSGPTVRALDFPIGVGGAYRAKLRNRPMYASVGLSAGILVHRAKVEGGVIRRIDPDVRVPLRLAWTVARVGASVAVVPGYSVRNRAYERQGMLVWARSAYRIGVMLGLHFDAKVNRTKRRPGARGKKR